MEDVVREVLRDCWRKYVGECEMLNRKPSAVEFLNHI